MEESEDKIKVLQLCAVDFTVRQFIAPLARYLKGNGCDVKIGCTKGPFWKELTEEGYQMEVINISRSSNPLMVFLSFINVLRYLKKNPVDVLHVHTPIAGLVGRLAGKMAKVPTIIYTAHGFYFHEHMPKWKYRFHVFLEKRAAKWHHALFCVSEEDARTAEELGIEAPSRIFLVRNGVRPEDFMLELKKTSRPKIRQELHIPPDATVVTIVGRLTREKGFFEFLEAAEIVRRDHPQTHFILVGGENAKERDRIKNELQSIIAGENLKGFAHMLGYRTDIADILAASDIFCLPSYREGLPTSIVEAMMLEIPVVATNVRGCREAVSDGTTGLLVPPRNSWDLAGAMRYLISHPETARKLGIAGSRRATEFYSLSNVLDTQWRAYQLVMRGKKK